MDRFQELLALAEERPSMKKELRQQNTKVVETLFEELFSKLEYSGRRFTLGYYADCAEIEHSGRSLISAFHESVTDPLVYEHFYDWHRDNPPPVRKRDCVAVVESGVGKRLLPDQIVKLVDWNIRQGNFSLLPKEVKTA